MYNKYIILDSCNTCNGCHHVRVNISIRTNDYRTPAHTLYGHTHIFIWPSLIKIHKYFHVIRRCGRPNLRILAAYLPSNNSLSSLRASFLSFLSCFSISWLMRFCSFASSLRQQAMLGVYNAVPSVQSYRPSFTVLVNKRPKTPAFLSLYAGPQG